MQVRHLHQRTRPFRYGGFWAVALCQLPVLPAAFAGEARAPLQVLGGIAFCLAWPWLADRLQRGAPPDGSWVRDCGYYALECALVALVLVWASVPILAGFATALCLLSGATALAGWRLLLPATVALGAGGAAGAALAPELTADAAGAAGALALAMVFGYTLLLGQVSFRQARRLAGHRRSLAEKSAALERINERLQRYLPPSLRARVLRAPDAPCRWERRWLTVAFVDLVGFTELSERLEAELLAAVLDEYLGALVPAAERRGGEVSKLLGDGMLVVFGLRDGADRAAQVQAAVGFCAALPELLARLADAWRRRGEPVALRTRAGIASGLCTLGDRGGDDRLDFTLIGPPVNLASRLQALAPVDGMLLDEASAALAQGLHPLGPPQALTIKGLGQVQAHPLVTAASFGGH
ncbi:MAG TPA: adenylate/guanylate cyclase domain-containing protein [Pseudomonadales bacterium]